MRSCQEIRILKCAFICRWTREVTLPELADRFGYNEDYLARFLKTDRHDNFYRVLRLHSKAETKTDQRDRFRISRNRPFFVSLIHLCTEEELFYVVYGVMNSMNARS